MKASNQTRAKKSRCAVLFRDGLIIAGTVLIFCLPADAQFAISRSSFGSVEAVVSGGDTHIRGIAGAAFSGGMTGAANKSEVGFWRLPQQLAAPALVKFGGGTTDNATPTLDWNDGVGAVSYELVYADNMSFVSATVVSGLKVSGFTFPQALADATYFWNVKVVGTAIQSAMSSTDSFAVIPTFAQWTVMLLALAMAGYMVWRMR